MNRRTARLTFAGTAAAAVLAGAGIAAAGHANPLLVTELDGRSEVASDAQNNRIVGDPNGRGEGYVFGIDDDNLGEDGVVDNSDTLCYVLIVDGIEGLDQNPGAPYMAHIHQGAEGENGPVVLNLAFPSGGQAADCLSENEVGKLGPAGYEGVVQDILAHPEGFYFNVHNAEYPAGAVRGQLAEQGLHGHGR